MSAASDRDALTVRGVGMTTPLGDGLDASCAALRAGLARFREMPWIALEDREKKPIVPVGALAFEEGLTGLGRFTRLAANALRDLFQSAGTPADSLAAAGLYVALPAPGRAGVDPRTHAELGAQLHEWLDLRPARTMKLFPSGHAGFVEALLAAARDLAAKRVPRAIVGGVDSLVDPETVRWLHGARRIKAGDRPVGLFPGEGAAFALIELGAGPPSGRGAPPGVTILGPSIATESATFDRDVPCTAAALSEAILRTRGALADGGDGLGLVVSDMNGEPYRSEEMGYAITRALSSAMGPNAGAGGAGAGPNAGAGGAGGAGAAAKGRFRLWHAADAIGDTGAAAPAIGLGMAARALLRGYARTDTALVLASSDGGLRGSFAVQKVFTKG